MIGRFISLLLLFATVTTASASEKLKAVASFSILGDLVQQVGGDRVSVTSLVGPNGDAHVYEPKPDDARQVAAADIMFVNGLGFEGWLERLLGASGSSVRLVTLGQGALQTKIASDPHTWQSVPNAIAYVKDIADALCAADAEGCSTYKDNAGTYVGKLQDLDAEIRKQLGSVPEQRRLVITSHDAFGYFAREYGVRFMAPEGISTDSEASAKDVAQLIEQVRRDGASALFVENLSDPRLMQQIASETGIGVGGALYSDALSDKTGPAASYIDMMRYNSSALVSAMLGS